MKIWKDSNMFTSSGRSGSPLFKDGKVILLLYGGIYGSECDFQSIIGDTLWE